MVAIPVYQTRDNTGKKSLLLFVKELPLNPFFPFVSIGLLFAISLMIS